MRTKSIVILLLAVVFSSCRTDKKESGGNNVFRVTLDVIAKHEDDFCLLYTTDGTSNFSDKTVWVHVKGNDAQQKVVFDLPKDVFPSQLRIDVGVNKEQEEITLKGIVFEYNGKKKESKGEEMRLLFRPDESKCTFDGPTGVIKALVKDGQKQIPSLYPQEVYLGPELKKLKG